MWFLGGGGGLIMMGQAIFPLYFPGKTGNFIRDGFAVDC
jgi:hypothetical protein